jgi:hypothetical protein
MKFSKTFSAAIITSMLLSEVSLVAAETARPTPTEEVQGYLKTGGLDGSLLIHEQKQMIAMRDGM